MSPEKPIDKQLSIVDEANLFTSKAIAEGHPLYPYFDRHIAGVDQWAKKILPFFPEADSEILLLSVQLHDVGQADGKYEEDHAIKSEKATIQFLSEKKYPKDRIEKVAHCVRAHRCRDVQPATVEARILAAADSASHMTDFVYIMMLGQDHVDKKGVLAKLDRDYRDVQWLPDELKQELKPLYAAWKDLILAFPKL
jgi:hypothetical protein